MEIMKVKGVDLVMAEPTRMDVRWIGHQEVKRQLQAAWLILSNEDLPMSPRIIGKPGIGKTTLAYAVARDYTEQVYILQCTVDTRPEDLLVTPVIGETQNIRYHASPLVTAMLKGGICILDEGNRMGEKSWASLAPLMDTRRYVESLIAGIKIPAHPDFRLAVTMNDDASTFDVPDYIQSRLQPQIEVGFPPAEEEMEILRVNLPEAPEDILKWVGEFLQQSHADKKAYSTRDGVNVARYAIKHIHLNQTPTLEAISRSLVQILGKEAEQLFLKKCVNKPKPPTLKLPNVLLLGGNPTPVSEETSASEEADTEEELEIELDLEDFDVDDVDFTLDSKLADALRAQGFEIEFIEITPEELEAFEAAQTEKAKDDGKSLPDLSAKDIPDSLNIAEWEKRRKASEAEDSRLEDDVLDEDSDAADDQA